MAGADLATDWAASEFEDRRAFCAVSAPTVRMFQRVCGGGEALARWDHRERAAIAMRNFEEVR